MSEPTSPPYGTRTLAEVLPSVLSAVGAPGFANPLGIEAADRAVVLLVDGLGWELLRAHERDAPYLSSLATGAPLHAGFPATTAVSLTSLGTGRPPGEHGLVGYMFRVPGHGVLNTLSWRPRGGGEDLREAVPPESIQVHPTQAELAGSVGTVVTATTPRDHKGSGLSRAALRGAQIDGVFAVGDLLEGLGSVRSGEVRYGYHGDLDLLGHLHGPGAPAWRRQLTVIDAMVAALVDDLPPGTVLVVVADHGMVAVTDRIEVDEYPELTDGLDLLGGEARVRHVYTRPGAQEDVRAAWRGVLGDRAWVRTRDEAIEAGWFGPVVEDAVRPRIGDLVVAMRGGAAVFARGAEPLEASLVGQHGSLTSAEQLVPLLVTRN